MTHRQLKDRTRAHYRWLLDEHLIPAFGSRPLASITSDEVRSWFTGFGADKPTVRSHAYGLLRSIMGTAGSDGKISLNPCVIRGAATTKRKHQIRPASPPELAKLTQAMPERYAAMILLASWCALRFGELTELRRRDVDLDADKCIGVIRSERAVVRVGDGFRVTTPKSDAGTRDVAVPPRLVPVIQAPVLLTTFPGDRDGGRGDWGFHGAPRCRRRAGVRRRRVNARPAVVLLSSSPYKARAAVTQGPFPLIAIVLLVIGLAM